METKWKRPCFPLENTNLINDVGEKMDDSKFITLMPQRKAC